jgi:hypothetical protein
MSSISPPGVEVIQEFVSTSPPVIQPFLTTVLVGPAFQVVSAFDDNGNPQEEAFAGTYRDGEGTIAYALPNLVVDASLVGFEDDVRVFLVYGAEVRELNSEADEEVLVDDGTGDFATGTPDTFTDPSQLFLQIGIEAGDFLRVTYLAEVVDIEITNVQSDTVLELADSVIDENLSSLTYDIVRNPPEFIFDATEQANAEFGLADNFLRLTAATLKEDGTTPGDYIGSAGDQLTWVITDSEHFLDGTLGAVGDSIFEDTGGGNFLTSVGARGAVAGSVFAQVGTPGSGQALRQVLAVIDDDRLIIETGEGTLTTQDWVVGSEAATGADGVTAGASTFSSATALFETDIQPAGAVPAGTFYIEIEGDGVYEVATVVDDQNITVTGTTGTDVAQAYTVINTVASGSGDGETKADTVFAHADPLATVDLTTLVDDGTEAINIGGTEAAVLSGSSVVDASSVTIPTATLTEGGLLTWSAVLAVSPLTLSFDPDALEVVVQLERAAGLSSSTMAEIEDAIQTDSNPAYNVVVSDIVDAALGGVTGDGAVAITEADLASIPFDGGSDDESLLIDGDLLGSSTPTAAVYVSYKALRVDLSPDATNPALWEIGSQDQREAILGPATIDNPLSLAAFLALTNSPTRAIKALGVGQVGASQPFGLSAAYIDALDFLSSENVHLILPLTQDPTTHQALNAHVTALSQPAEKAERIGMFNTSMPLFTKATVLGSGSQGNGGTGTGGTPSKMTGENPAEFRTSVDLVAAGAQAGDILVVTALSGASSELEAVDGTIGPLFGLPILGVKSGDDFVLELDASGLTDTAWDLLIDVDWALYRAGTSITQPVDQGEVIAQTSEGFANRRMFHLWPDQVSLDVNGTEQLLPGFYLAAGWAGKANAISPEFGFSRTDVAGYLSLRNSNTYFTKAQLDRIAGGGTWISVQESQNAPIKCRHQLSTDTSSVEKQEFSITRVVDYTAIYLRQGLDRQVGKFNITQSYLDGLSSTIQGLLRSLVESGKLRSASLVSIGVNEVRPDKVDVVVAINVPFPANLIEITLQI